jgi:hypothetical protein
MKGTTTLAIFFTVIGLGLYINMMSKPNPPLASEEVAIISISKETYTKGANDALDRMVLLDLEQQLQGGSNRNWNTMAEVVCERLSVQRIK